MASTASVAAIIASLTDGLRATLRERLRVGISIPVSSCSLVLRSGVGSRGGVRSIIVGAGVGER